MLSPLLLEAELRVLAGLWKKPVRTQELANLVRGPLRELFTHDDYGELADLVRAAWDHDAEPVLPPALTELTATLEALPPPDRAWSEDVELLLRSLAARRARAAADEWLASTEGWSPRLGAALAELEGLDRATMEAVEQLEVNPGITTGLLTLDELTGGLRPGRLWWIHGLRGGGKTTLASTMLLAAMRSGASVAWLSGELERAQVALRATAVNARIPLQQLRGGQLGSMEAWVELARATAEQSEGEVRVAQVESVDALHARLQELDVQVLFVDELPRRGDLEGVDRALGEWARRTASCVVVTSSVEDEVEADLELAVLPVVERPASTVELRRSMDGPRGELWMERRPDGTVDLVRPEEAEVRALGRARGRSDVVGGVASWNRLVEERRYEAFEWRCSELVVRGGPSFLVVDEERFSPPVPVLVALQAADDVAWARCAELTLGDGRVLCVRGGKAWFSGEQ